MEVKELCTCPFNHIRGRPRTPQQSPITRQSPGKLHSLSPHSLYRPPQCLHRWLPALLVAVRLPSLAVSELPCDKQGFVFFGLYIPIADVYLYWLFSIWLGGSRGSVWQIKNCTVTLIITVHTPFFSTRWCVKISDNYQSLQKALRHVLFVVPVRNPYITPLNCSATMLSRSWCKTAWNYRPTTPIDNSRRFLRDIRYAIEVLHHLLGVGYHLLVYNYRNGHWPTWILSLCISK